MKTSSWKPVLKGKTYCSPACGGGCKLKDYEFARRQANRLAREMGPPWKARVWENLAWYWGLEAKVGNYWASLWISRDGWYTCAISLCRGAGTPGLYDTRSFKDPRKAVRASFKAAKDKADNLNKLVNTIERRLL